MPEKLMWVEWDDDAHLSRSRTKPGSYSPLTRDGDKKLGHATLRDPEPGDEPFSTYARPMDERAGDDREQISAQEVLELVEMLIRLGIFVYEEVPRFRAWWRARITPLLVTTRLRLTSVRKRAIARTPQGVVERDGSRSVLQLEGVRPAVSAVEAGARLAAALRKEAITERELQLVRGLRFHDRDPGVRSGRELGGGTLLQIGGADITVAEDGGADRDPDR
ncbi:MAG: hypothetical protein ABW025_00425 [Cellulomonas sp.]